MNNFLNEQFLKDWMGLLEEDLKDKRLIDIASPGSHNSNTYTLNSTIKGKFVQNQKVNITKQLELGVRLLDLRYGMSENKTILLDQHGDVKGDYYIKNFIQIRDFLQEHPKEFIVVTIQAEEVITEEMKILFIKSINDLLEEFLINKKDCETWFNLCETKMEDIWKTKKRVFLVYHPYKVLFKGAEHYGVFCAENCFDSYWHDVMETNLLFQSNLDRLVKRKECFDDFHNKIFVNQFIMTIQRSVSQVIKKVLYFDVPTIENFVSKINQKNMFHHFLLDNKDQPFNYLLLDLIHLDINILLIIISLNIKNKKIKIRKGYLGGFEKTNELNNAVFNNDSIYLSKENYVTNDVEKKNLVILYEFDKQLFFYTDEDIVGNIFIFNNPLIKQEFLNIKSFSIMISSSYIYTNVSYNENQDYLQNMINNYNTSDSIYGFCYHHKKLIMFKEKIV